MHLNRNFLAIPTAAWIFSALFVLSVAPIAAHASTITVGVNGSATLAPAGGVFLQEVLPLPGGSLTLDLNLNLPGAEVASIFQADFIFNITGDWSVALDMTGVDPGVSPFGVGTWPGAVGLNTGSQANLSLISANAGGERLVAQLIITRNGSAPTDLFSVSLTSNLGRIIVAKDIPGGVELVPLSTLPGQTLMAVPEPNSAFLFASGLFGLTLFFRSRSA